MDYKQEKKRLYISFAVVFCTWLFLVLYFAMSERVFGYSETVNLMFFSSVDDADNAIVKSWNPYNVEKNNFRLIWVK